MSDTSYDSFIDELPGVLDTINSMRAEISSLTAHVEDDFVSLDLDEIIKILEQDLRIERISATDDMLEIYTIPIKFNINDCNVFNDVKDLVDLRHEELNFGSFVIFIKPGFMPFAFPYDVSEYNVPPMYRQYNTDFFVNTSDIKNFKVYLENSRRNIHGIDSYAWILSEVGRTLGCYQYQKDEDYVRYSVLVPHPHVNGCGHICYGNIKDMLYDAIEMNAINFIVNITLDVLFTYNGGNPYFNMWSANSCSLCPDRYTYMCNDCQCYDCGSHKCDGCSNFRQPSLYQLFRLRKGLLRLYVYDTRITKEDRVKEMRDQIEILIEKALNDNSNISKSDLLFYLKEDEIEEILKDDYDYDMG